MVFRSPQYYKELRKYRREKELRERNKSGQVISTDRSRDKSSVAPIERSPGLGQKHQAPSSKPQASSTKLLEPQAASVKPQA